MICWKCGHLNEDTKQFCDQCGANIWHAEPVSNGQQQTAENAERGQTGAGIHGNQTAAHSGSRQPQFPVKPVLAEKEKSGAVKIVAIVFAVLYLIRTVMFIPSFFSTILGVFDYSSIFISLINLIFAIAWMISFILLVGSLVVLAMRRTEANEESLYLAVVLAEALHVIVSLIRMIWKTVYTFTLYRGRMGSKTVLTELMVILFAFLVLGTLFALFVREGKKPLLGKDKCILKQMVKDLPTVLQTEFEILSANLSKAKGNKDSTYQGQVSFDKGGYGGQPSNPPGVAGGPLKTHRGVLLFIVLTFITCGIYPWYFYYSVAKDANIICEGDGEETAGLLKHILLLFVTCGIYEYIWHCQFADRLRRNASRYGVTIEENGTTVLLWFIPGSFCCGIGSFVAYHIQMKNLNKMARAYNGKMFAQNRTNV